MRVALIYFQIQGFVIPLPIMASLSVDQLRQDIAEKKIDTVVVAMTDMQGRLVGKRLDANYFL